MDEWRKESGFDEEIYNLDKLRLKKDLKLCIFSSPNAKKKSAKAVQPPKNHINMNILT